MENNENWGQSVAGIVIKEDKVLLVRHTYGAGTGKLIIPGGYVKNGESPQEAVKREVFEETGISVNPTGIVGVRFNTHDWYVAFNADYVEGDAHSDNDENNEVIWLGIDEIATRDDIPELTKILVKAAISGEKRLVSVPYEGNAKHAPYSLFCCGS